MWPIGSKVNPHDDSLPASYRLTLGKKEQGKLMHDETNVEV